MSNVWKIGSRWGNMSWSILDRFIDYGCVYFGSADEGRCGNWRRVVKGDVFVITAGTTPVAIAEATGCFKPYKESGIAFREDDIQDCVQGNSVVVCPARIFIIPKEERNGYWGVDARKRFCLAPKAASKVRDVYQGLCAKCMSDTFDILTRTESLFDNDSEKSIFSPNIKYHIPIYQRPYSWGEPELRRLMEDIRRGAANDEPIFLGTVQLSQPIPLSEDGRQRSYDVIDGQQRLTTFSILVAVLEHVAGMPATMPYKSIRTSVNKRAAQDDLNMFCKLACAPDFLPSNACNDLKNRYVENALILNSLLQEISCRDDVIDDAQVPESDIREYAKKLLTYVKSNVKIVVIETHAGLSKTLKIFNTINSTGLDLGAEDVFKVRFYEYLRANGGDESAFDSISSLYENVGRYNRSPFAGTALSIETILSVYQRILIGSNDLSVDTFSMSQENFFNQLLDTLLHVREWSPFKKFSARLSIEDLEKIFDCYKQYLKMCDECVELKIYRYFLWETRYGYVANFPVVAMYLGVANEANLVRFVKSLFKALVPASIRFQKTLNRGRFHLVSLLKAMATNKFTSSDSILELARESWFDGNLDSWASEGMSYELAWMPKSKNLICRMVEYLLTNPSERNELLFKRLFQPERGFDIEHIQPYTDQDDRDAVWKEWGEEINRIGNLAMFESDLNRAVKNEKEKKMNAYATSEYRSLSYLSDKIMSWSKRDAEQRRVRITEMVGSFLKTDD